MKTTRSYLILVIGLFYLSTGCSNIKVNSGLSKSEIYLQSADSKKVQSENYGYSKDNPITLKYSASLDYDLIIDEYIKRLNKNGTGINEEKIQSFYIVEKHRIQQTNETISKLYSCEISSKNETEIVKLYFQLNPKAGKFGVPKYFLYSYLTGSIK